MNIERIKKVIETTDATPEPEFDPHVWWEINKGCGSCGCIIGNYILRTPQCGLQLQFDRLDKFASPIVKTPSGDLRSYKAVGYHLGIDPNDATWLFDPASYIDIAEPEKPTKQQMLDRLRAFLAHGGRPPVEVNLEDSSHEQQQQPANPDGDHPGVERLQGAAT